MGDSHHSIGAANSAANEPPVSEATFKRRGSLVGAGNSVPSERRGSITGAGRLGRRASEFGVSLVRIPEQQIMASPNLGSLEASSLAAALLASKSPSTADAAAVGMTSTVHSALKSSKSTIDPVLSPDIRNLFAKVIFSDRQEVLYNTQCQVCVLIDSVSRHFRMRSFRFGSWKRFISGAPGSAGSGSGSGSGSGTEGDLELDSSEQDEQLIDLLDRAGKPLRLWLHSREPASKFVQARQSYFVASVQRVPGKAKYTLLSKVALKGGLKKEFEIADRPPGTEPETRKPTAAKKMASEPKVAVK